jgi:hypothetical protein
MAKSSRGTVAAQRSTDPYAVMKPNKTAQSKQIQFGELGPIKPTAIQNASKRYTLPAKA